MKRIEVFLTGRLGNQLFQYSFARALQKKYGGEIICNIYELEHVSEKLKHIDTKFNYDMENFALNNNVQVIDRKMPWYADSQNIVVKFFKKYFPKLYFRIMFKVGYIIWQREEYIEIPKIKNDNITLYGWWQDFRYFDYAIDNLQNEIVPILPPKEENEKIYKLAEDSNSVCISVRGGNYLHPKVKKKLFVCGKNYFYNAIRTISNIIDNPKFVIFSDDLTFVKEYLNFEEEFPMYSFEYESGKDSVEEKINMMTRFNSFIISNSSFSWWAQYLSKSPNKIVIAPNKWYTDGRKCNLYMDEWILVDTDEVNL